MRTRALFACLSLLWLILIVWGGCAAFDDARLPTRDAGASDVTTTNADGGSGCPTHRVDLTPPPPTSGGADEEFVLTVRDITLGLEDGGVLSPRFGYDLDNTCTCKPDPDSCLRPLRRTGDGGGAGVDAGPACDGEEGRDDATGNLLAQLAAVAPDPATYANEAIDQGFRGILIRIKGYNGLDDDSDVKVSLYRSAGIYGGVGTVQPPTWAPEEKWSVDTDDVVQPPLYDGKNSAQSAFVKAKKLVAELQTSSFPFNSDAEILLNDVTLTADLEKVDGRWTLQRAIAVGRWPIDDALRTVLKVQDPQKSSQRICENSNLVTLVRSALCGAVDINSSDKQDGKGQPCNAMSTAVGFRATPASFGAIITPKRTDPCAAKPVDDCPK